MPVTYRPGLILPLAVVAAGVGIAYVATGPHQARDAWFFLAFWAVVSLPVIMRRRGAVILTPTALLYRPYWGKVLEIR